MHDSGSPGSGVGAGEPGATTDGADPVAARPVPSVSVLMPTYQQAAFLGRALDGLAAQTLTDWELIVVDDGSTDATAALLAPIAAADPRISVVRFEQNRGLGAALNAALDGARADVVAYLPSDDYYDAVHLASLVALLANDRHAVLAFAGCRHHHGRLATGQIENEPLQLVQVGHRRTADRWMERDELTTDDLDRMMWGKLRRRGGFAGSGRATCEWVDHPAQRHKAIREPSLGGVNPYRRRYRVDQPLRFQSTAGNRIDEVALYRRFRERPDTPRAADGLEILLAGELAYNPERVLALEEQGHRLRGLWTDDGWHFNTVGPLPFGHVAEVPRADWRAELRQRPPDVVYALLNWQAVPFAHEVMEESRRLGIPFVWHFKEGPWLCLERGLWPKLFDLHTRSDGQIYSSPELRDWFRHAIPEAARGGHERTLVLDGDLPKRDWLDAPRSLLRSAEDGAFHTVVPGRPIGLQPSDLGALAAGNVHLHFYGDVNHHGWGPWVDEARAAAPGHLHLHPNVDQSRWVEEFSRYDAGWLHFLGSENGGDVRRASWDDLNYPARLATLMASGVPLVQRDNADHLVACQSLARERELGLFVESMADLGAQLADRDRMDRLRASVWLQRETFAFDHHVDRLVGFFRQVMVAGDR